MQFAGQTVVVTAAACEAGEAIVSAFGAEGARVVAADAAFVGLSPRGQSGLQLAHNVASEQSWQDLVQVVVERFARLDVLVNGTGCAVAAPLVDLSPEAWRWAFDQAATGVFLGLKHVAPVMRRQGHGAVVNVSQVAALVGSTQGACAAAAQGAVLGLTRAAAVELAPWGLRVNAVTPGIVASQKWTRETWWPAHVARHGGVGRAWRALAARTPTGRLVEPREVAEAVVFLASARAAGAVGANLVVDGGFTAC